MKVLFFSPTPNAGTPQYCHALACALSELGHEVTLLTSLGYEFTDKAPPYRVLEVIDRYRLRPVRLMKFITYLLREQPEIVHFFGAQRPKTYLMLAKFLRLLGRMPFVYSPLDVFSNWENEDEQEVFTSLYGLMAHSFTDNSVQMKKTQELFGVPDDRISAFPMPDISAPMRDVTPEPVQGLPGDAPLVLCFGLIHPRKGIDVLIDSFPEVLRAVPKARLAIVGRPDCDVEPYHDRLRALGIVDRVEINADYVSFEAMAGYFNRARVVALPYVVGWTSGALVTAFGYGRPVVATRIDAMVDMVVEGENGLLVTPGDASDLARGLIEVLQDDALQARLSEGAVRTDAANTWLAKAQDAEEKYRAVLNER